LCGGEWHNYVDPDSGNGIELMLSSAPKSYGEAAATCVDNQAMLWSSDLTSESTTCIHHLADAADRRFLKVIFDYANDPTTPTNDMYVTTM